jgi:hypothetical protein
MRCLTLGEVLDLHRRAIKQSGGADGARELGGVQSAVAALWFSDVAQRRLL